MSQDIAYMWKLRQDADELRYKKKQTHRHGKKHTWLSKGKRWEGMNQELGISRHRLLYVQCTRSYCTAQGTAFSASVVINHNGKEDVKE